MYKDMLVHSTEIRHKMVLSLFFGYRDIQYDIQYPHFINHTYFLIGLVFFTDFYLGIIKQHVLPAREEEYINFLIMNHQYLPLKMELMDAACL